MDTEVWFMVSLIMSGPVWPIVILISIAEVSPLIENGIQKGLVWADVNTD